MSSYTDQEIIQQIQAGDIDAYKNIVDRYSSQLLNLCYRYLQSTEEAEDATQEVFLKAYSALTDWEPRAQFKTWLYRIAINHCLNIVRRQKIIRFQSLQKMQEDVSPTRISGLSHQEPADSVLVTQQKEELIRYFLQQLSESYRHVLILYFYQQLSYKEIAEILNISLSSVESRLFRAKKKLAKIISRQNIS